MLGAQAAPAPASWPPRCGCPASGPSCATSRRRARTGSRWRTSPRPAAGLPYGTLKGSSWAWRWPPRRTCSCSTRASGLSHEEVDELAGPIEDVRADMTILLVEHHMGMVMRLSDTVVVLTSVGGRDRAAGAGERESAVLAAYLGTPA